MRRGEILAVGWQDINLDAGLVFVRRSLQETKAGVSFKQPKSRRGRRPLTLPSLAVEMLRTHEEKQAQMKHALGADYQDNGLVCGRDDGSIWPPSAFTSAYRDLLRRRKIENVRFHDLRHSHASQLLRDGVPIKVVSERLEHAKAGFSLDVYGHVLPGQQEEAARKSDVALRAALEKQRRPLA